MELHVYPKCPDLKAQFTEQAYELFKSMFIKHSNNLLKYSLYETVEETVKNYNIHDYYNMFNRAAKEQGSKYLYDQTKIELPSILLKYTNSDLKRLFENEDVCIVTQFAIDRLKNGSFNHLIVSNKPEYDKKYGKYYNERLYMNIIHDSYVKELEAKNGCEYEGLEKDIEMLNNAVKATEILYNMFKNPNEKDEIWQFIINEICHTERTDLVEIMRRYRIKFNDKRGRPNNNLKVYKFDVNTLKVLAVYENRQECIEKEGIGKPFLSLLISGKRKSYKNCTFGEMTEERLREIQAIDEL